MIEFRSTTFSYDVQHPVLDNISVSIDTGETILMVGQNGAGKSTFLKLMNGLLKPTSGNVFVNGLDTLKHSTAQLARYVSVTFQHPADQIFAPTVREELAFAPRNLGRAHADELIQYAARTFRFDHLLHAHPYDLPAATRKLLTVASAFASDAPVIALDEPSAGLSHPERQVLTSAILARRTTSFVIVSHDLELFLPLCTRVLVLGRGAIHFDGSPEQFLASASQFRTLGVRLPTVVRLRRLIEHYS